MARVTAPTVLEAARGQLTRNTVDERAHWFAEQVREILDLRITSSGAERVPTGRAYIYMSNHQSHIDIPVLYATLPSPTIRMLGKEELFKIPIWGRGLRAAEFIAIDRTDHASAVASIARAAELVRDGVSIFIAPEGTRSRDGRVGPLKKGGFHLAMDVAAPIVPVAIRGTLAVLPRGTASMRRGCQIHVTIGAPIEVVGRTMTSLIDEVDAFLHANVEV